MIMRRIALLSATLLTGACTVGPDYVRPPEAKINQAAPDFTEAQAKAFSASDLPHDWWRLYDDPVLNKLIEQALAKNTDLRIAAANIKRADAYKAEIDDAKSVHSNISGTIGYGQQSAEEHLLFDETLPSDYMYSLDAGLSYPLDLAGQIKRAMQAARAESAASRAAYDRVRIGVVAEAGRTYLDVCAAGRDLDLARSTVLLAEQLNRANAQLVATGRAASVSQRGYEAQVWRTKAAIPELEARQKTALYRLSALLGDVPQALPAEVSSCHEIPLLKTPVPTGDGRAFLQRRPDIREAEENLKAATARIGVAMGDLYPHISLGISGGSLGLLSRFGNADTYKYSTGPLISWDFPARGAVKARIKQAEAGDEAAFAAFDRTVLNALRDAETALSVYARDLDRNHDLQQATATRARSREDSEELLAGGRQTLMDVLNARRNHLAAEQELAASQAKLAGDQMTLFWVLGGGW